MKKISILFLALALMLVIGVPNADAHQSGCHKNHSCPSDTGSYVCGDLGNDSECLAQKDESKSLKICEKSKKKIDKKSTKLSKEFKKKNLSAKKLAKLESKRAVLVKKTEEYVQSCGTPLPRELTGTDYVLGTGKEALPGKKVTVSYVGMLPNGTIFDASARHEEVRNGFTFTLGAGNVIRGWDIGIVRMREGGKRTLTIPATYAYGAEGVPGVVPSNATLIFDVQLLRVQ